MRRVRLLATAILVSAMGSFANLAFAGHNQTASDTDLLVKFADEAAVQAFSTRALSRGAKTEELGVDNWVRVAYPSSEVRNLDFNALRNNKRVLAVQPNFKIHLIENYQAKNPSLREQIAKANKARGLVTFPYPDNPNFVAHGPTSAGPDPKFNNQWGMIDIGVATGWKAARGDGIIVAVIDTGVDYTHEDLVDNLWRNAGETGKDANGKDKSTNGLDDDGNGFVDDVIGWDFSGNDNKPFDYRVSDMDLLAGGGNPGHGTHCAGNVAAVAENGVGVAGVAPNAKIMVLRFLSETGGGDTASAIKSINYAVKMGAQVLSNSWGSEGEDPSEGSANQALRDAVIAAMNKGSLFVAAAGNGHQGVGYDNDSDAKPGFPASYPIENIVSVAALDKNDKLGGFSNWGKKTVHIGAPGVSVFSTTVGGKYTDLVVDLPAYGLQIGWDGTSMATPHVAGAAALYWSKHPNATWKDVKAALLHSARPIPALTGKSVSEGKLDVQRLMQE